jgi:hypothetical protein
LPSLACSSGGRGESLYKQFPPCLNPNDSNTFKSLEDTSKPYHPSSTLYRSEDSSTSLVRNSKGGGPYNLIRRYGPIISKSGPSEGLGSDVFKDLGGPSVGRKSTLRLSQEHVVKQINQGRHKSIIGALIVGHSPYVVSQ